MLDGILISPTNLRCVDGDAWVPSFRVCDGYYHCDDYSDEDASLVSLSRVLYSILSFMKIALDPSLIVYIYR